MVSLNLTAVLEESEVKGLRAGLKELLRCQKELRSLVPDLDHTGQVDIENLLLTDRPEFAPRIRILLNTMQDVRQEVQKVAEKASKRLRESLCSALLPGSETFVDKLEYEDLLDQVMSS